MPEISLFVARTHRKAVYSSIVAVLTLLTSSCSLSEPQRRENPTAQDEKTQPWWNFRKGGQTVGDSTPNCENADPVAVATAKAAEATALARSAQTPEAWDTVVLSWMQAIAAMQSVPTASPKRVYAQKKVAEYQQNLATAQKQASEKLQLPFTSFSNSFLDNQLLLFLSYIAAVGPPDILIIGSSRAIQGIDPRQLQTELASRGQANVSIFNFGVNGATARLVELILLEVLTPQQLPKLIIWADGVRALNSGRSDRTTSTILASAGYQRLKAGSRPALPELLAPINPNCPPAREGGWWQRLESWNPLSVGLARALDLTEIDANGFLPRSNRFAPGEYYSKFPRVAGRYDGDYQNFNLWGEQTLALKRLAATLQARQIPLVFVNLPLSEDYLDTTRSRYEQQFRAFMQQQAREQGFTFVDLTLDPTLRDNGYFFDPSHLNRFGAIAVAQRLAAQPQIPWQQQEGTGNSERR
ncbi:hypothetical protein [Oscillatoria sp. FACHB-1406]|uniref:hypothetical protein n=1 Tax=Oscillatoria sp. FACHB-1406 TaxID=2692846 RepID=UPI001682EF6A|nr:hypothetical protein [Oscillatoria sp. FACHB-1406]MBD2579298.1 hypothetical protein [Oscillatoria sp. FACHB-1406]